MEEILIDKYLEGFKKHLDNNERTIFSAKFGDGKTYFLNQFKKKYKDNYYFVTLFPVNYSVSENKDVFEYVKRDILLQLANGGKLNPLDLEAASDSLFNWENLKEVINFLLSFMPHSDFYKKLIGKAEKFASTYNDKKNSFGKYNEFFKQQKGGIYEKDGYTQIIEQAIHYIKDHENKKTVLIIEDLDRIDPAHLFRILNVLGAHIDDSLFQAEEKKNKFGFDNIVTVFDYEMTKHMFHHFYGEQANYDGYINKFKAHQPYFYSINQVANDYLIKYIEDNCHISSKLLEGTSEHSVLKIIKKLSIRDVCQILSEIDEQIEVKNIPAHLTEFYFSSYGPLTIFMSILVRLGVKREDVKVYILKNIKGEELLNLLSSFLATDTWICTQSIINYQGNNFDMYKDISDKKITKIEFQESIEHYGDSSRYNNIDKAIDRALNIALNCIYY